MTIKLDIVDLIYEGKKINQKGTTYKEEKKISNIKISVIDLFSIKYYSDKMRDYNHSVNILIDQYYLTNINENDISYNLKFINYKKNKYLIKNKLQYKKNNRLYILDCERVKI